MSTFVSDLYANFENNVNRRYGLPDMPYESTSNDKNAYVYTTPTFVFPSNYNNFKNVKSGKYNRRTCFPFKFPLNGYGQSPGVYPITLGAPPNINYIPENYQRDVNKEYDYYQKVRMCNGGKNSACGIYDPPGYSNYFSTEQYNLYPKQYMKTWPDELLGEVTRAPDPYHTYGYNLPVNNC